MMQTILVWVLKAQTKAKIQDIISDSDQL